MKDGDKRDEQAETIEKKVDDLTDKVDKMK